MSMCRNLNIESEVMEGMLKEGISETDANKRVIEILAKRQTTIKQIPNISISEIESDKIARAMEEAILIRSGVKIEKPVEGVEQFRNYSLTDCAAEFLERQGQKVRGLDKETIIKRALQRDATAGTSDFPNILANVMNKQAMVGYPITQTTQDIWTKKGTLSDFKPASRVRLSEARNMTEIPEGGQFPHTYLADSGEQIRLKTFGDIFSLTRQAIINDDLSMFSEVPAKMGNAAKRQVNYAVYKYLASNPIMADGKPLFCKEHGNLGNSQPFSIPALSELRTLMRKQRDMKGLQPLNIDPQYILLPVEMYDEVRSLMATDKLWEIKDGVQKFTENPYYNALTPITDAAISDFSNKAWYIIAPWIQAGGIEVAYLNGNDNPVLESRIGFDVDGIELKMRLDYGIAAFDYRGIAKNEGGK